MSFGWDSSVIGGVIVLQPFVEYEPAPQFYPLGQSKGVDGEEPTWKGERENTFPY